MSKPVVLFCGTCVLSALFLGPASGGESEDRPLAVESGLLPRQPVEGVDWTLEERMARYRVPGVSIAVFRDFELEWAGGYGVRDVNSAEPVTPETMFQAASISKALNAAMVMTLVQDGELDLDEDVRELLLSWELPENHITVDHALTLRHLLSHSGGLTVHGFGGYHCRDPLPSVPQILNGEPPANSPPVVMDIPPLKQYRYAGGGTTVVQLMLTDLTGEAYPELMRERVYEPVGMTRSTSQQPLPVDVWGDHASGHLQDGSRVPGGFHVYPEMAAAGLWTTPTDLARFALQLQRALQGDTGGCLQPATVAEMITPVLDSAGLGFFRRGEWFEHGGANEGFRCQLYAHAQSGSGAVVMTNSDNGGQLYSEIFRAIARVYDWDRFATTPVAARTQTSLDLDACTGRFDLAAGRILWIERRGEELHGAVGLEVAVELVPIDATEFMLLETGQRLRFEPAPDGSLTLRVGGVAVPRVPADQPRTTKERLAAGEEDGVIEELRQLAQQEPGAREVAPATLQSLVEEFYGAGRAAAATKVASLSVELHAGNLDSLDTLAWMYEKTGDVELARNCWERMLELAGNLPGDEEVARRFAERARRGLHRYAAGG